MSGFCADILKLPRQRVRPAHGRQITRSLNTQLYTRSDRQLEKPTKSEVHADGVEMTRLIMQDVNCKAGTATGLSHR